MDKLIARLIDCGMSRSVALFMFSKFKQQGKLVEFEAYVESVEAADHEQNLDPV